MTLPAIAEDWTLSEVGFPPELDRAWAAGFFDGEGNTGTNGLPHKPCLRISLGQAGDYDSLHRFAAIVEVGKIYGPYPQRKPGWAPQMHFHAHNDDAIQVITLLFPYLGQVKRHQAAEAVMEWYRAKKLNAAAATLRREQRKERTRTRTRCKRGHELTPETIYFMDEDPLRPNCRVCSRQAAARSYYKNK